MTVQATVRFSFLDTEKKPSLGHFPNTTLQRLGGRLFGGAKINHHNKSTTHGRCLRLRDSLSFVSKPPRLTKYKQDKTDHDYVPDAGRARGVKLRRGNEFMAVWPTATSSNP